jgi:spermidine synthase
MTRHRDHKKNQTTALAAPEGAGRDRLRRALLIAIAFVSGAAIMVLELAGNRVLAPWFGNSLYTWTGLIGVVLVSLSCGYYLGGYVADRKPSDAVLASMLLAAALLTMLIPVLQVALRGSLEKLDVVWGPVVATTLLLALPGGLLAAVFPFTVKLISLLADDRRVGRSTGAVGMASTLGSVLGTFAAGFVLIPHLPLRIIFFATGAVLAALGMAGCFFCSRQSERRWLRAAILVVLLVGVAVFCIKPSPLDPSIIHDQTTFYHRIRVIEAPAANGDVLRYLYLDTTREGAQYARTPELPLAYQRYWELSAVLVPDLRRAAFIGGGGFAMPEALLDYFTEAEADVLEIDPAVIDVGRKYFRVDEYPRMRAMAEDGRRWLARTDRAYDLIFADAYNGVAQIPAHLVTVEFFELVKRRLTEEGVYMMNVRSAVEGPRARVFQAIHNTLGEVFSHVDVLAIDPTNRNELQNVFLVAASHDFDLAGIAAREKAQGGPLTTIFEGYLPASRLQVPPAPVLRDDRNPIEYLVAQTLVAAQ